MSIDEMNKARLGRAREEVYEWLAWCEEVLADVQRPIMDYQ